MTISVCVVDASMRALARRLLPPTRRVVLGGGRAYFFYWHESARLHRWPSRIWKARRSFAARRSRRRRRRRSGCLPDDARSRVVGVS